MDDGFGPLRGSGTDADPWRRADRLGNDWEFDTASAEWKVAGPAPREHWPQNQTSQSSLPQQFRAKSAAHGSNNSSTDNFESNSVVGRKRSDGVAGSNPSVRGKRPRGIDGGGDADRRRVSGGPVAGGGDVIREAEEAKRETNSILVSRVPGDVTAEEISQFCKRAGVIKKDKRCQRAKVWRLSSTVAGATAAAAAAPSSASHVATSGDAPRNPSTGDAAEWLVTYFRPESVRIAADVLDETVIRAKDVPPGVRVVSLTLEQKQALKMRAVDRPGRDKRAKTSHDVALAGGKKERLYDQAAELSWGVSERTAVVLRHMFSQDEAWEDPEFFSDLIADVRPELEKFGTLKTLKVFESHPQGVILAKFDTHIAATTCIARMRGRWFGKQRIAAAFHDGVEDLNVKESEEVRRKREASWAAWFGGDDDDSGSDESSDKV